jgi:hypothetical protein
LLEKSTYEEVHECLIPVAVVALKKKAETDCFRSFVEKQSSYDN